ncbi:MAG TPA: hypothetical protein VMW24_06565 [Sedimentisphaerales bacterium]|nr:hypothetical protein [Sedimentisphaerales bacterium]
MSQFIRSGKPVHINGTTTAGTADHWPCRGTTNQLVVNNVHASEPIEVFLTLEAMAAGAGNGFTIRAGYGHSFPVEVIEFWTLSTNASTFQAVAIHRT